MSKKKGQRQHFVPQFLLRNWAGRDRKIGVFRIDGSELRYSRKSPKSMGFKHGLYALEGVKEEEVNVVEEKLFGPIDNYSALIVRKLLEPDVPRISDNEFDWLAHFVAALEMRTPRKVREMKEMASSVLEDDLRSESEVNSELREFIEHNSELIKKKVDNATLQNLGPIIGDAAKRFREFLTYWKIEKFPEGKKHLFLSDHPCMRSKGVGYLDSVLALPLSPYKLLLGFRNREMANSSITGPELLRKVNLASLDCTERYLCTLGDYPRLFLERGIANLQNKL